MIGGGFHHVTVKAMDFDKSVGMYKRLGFTEYAMWGTDDARYILLDTGGGNYLEITNGGTGPKDGVLNHFAIRTDDCEKAYKTALDAGFKPVTALMSIDLPSDPPIPLTFAFVAGPDGEQIELLQER
jgi:catechol 2,3-dioxygenase-like lactoylglutathione lyase family enzyme